MHLLRLESGPGDYAGGSLGWLTPFALLTGAGLVVGYGLLGACWIRERWFGSEHPLWL